MLVDPRNLVGMVAGLSADPNKSRPPASATSSRGLLPWHSRSFAKLHLASKDQSLVKRAVLGAEREGLAVDPLAWG